MRDLMPLVLFKEFSLRKLNSSSGKTGSILLQTTFLPLLTSVTFWKSNFPSDSAKPVKHPPYPHHSEKRRNLRIHLFNVGHKCRWSVYAQRVGFAPGAWWTGPSKNGARINRPGRSHVSVYTGRPWSSTTGALDSLCAAISHTIHLHLLQIQLYSNTWALQSKTNLTSAQNINFICISSNTFFFFSKFVADILRPFSFRRGKTNC